ncbi:MAG TPA: DUF3417 domain-containing protein [Sulfuricaulis sp.]|nr:DUF3417 domain-containing protein [Sulfuricaulis sp.]
MPNTISVEIRPILPASLKRLEELVGDLYFTCENEVPRLFRFLDEECWEACGQNPKVFLRRIAQGKLDAAAHDPVFLALLNSEWVNAPHVG